MSIRLLVAICFLTVCRFGYSQESRIEVDASRELHRVSPWLTGACIEDVNHEIYGGIYSQMIFGESFQEPPLPVPIRRFQPLGGTWRIENGELLGGPGDGPKLVSDVSPFSNGEVSVDIFFQEAVQGNSGMIVRLSEAGVGADNFEGYEVSLNPGNQTVLLGRHRHNWNPLREIPCEVKLKQWMRLTARLKGKSIEVLVDGKSMFTYEDGEQALTTGTICLRQWQREARYRNLQYQTGDRKESLPFQYDESSKLRSVSSMWRPIQSGTAEGDWSLDRQEPYIGTQSQSIQFVSGEGTVGIENRGLNRWGMSFVDKKNYEAIVWAKSESLTELWACLESQDGSRILAEERLYVKPGPWQRIEFQLTPMGDEPNGRFSFKLKKPGAVTLGYALLQPGTWGRFQDLPIRGDVGEGLIQQGVTILRYGGSMVNHPAYRWKNMIGPRDRRSPYAGFWYPYSTNGWGIIDFMNFCEAANFEYVPTFHMGETVEDMADFMAYAKGSAETEWGQKRIRDGHPMPYRLKHIQLGNEERVDLAYAEKFAAMAKVIWAADPEIIIVVGDFVYTQPIRDPFDFRGAASNITSLEGQQRILQMAAEANREVWFDVHVGTDGPRPDSSFDAMFTFKEALTKIAKGARFKVVVFEFNSASHGQQRALGNALAINAIERDGQIPIACAANCLQSDGQNDNGWDQGLLFLNPTKVWLQPPGYVTQMFSKNYQPRLVQCAVKQSKNDLDCNAKLSEDGRTLVMQLVNPTDRTIETTIQLAGFVPTRAIAKVIEMKSSLHATNTAAETNLVQPEEREWQHAMKDAQTKYTVAPYSVTLLRWQ